MIFSSCFLFQSGDFFFFFFFFIFFDCDIDPYIYIYQIMAPAALTTTQHDESTIRIMSKTIQGYEQQQQQKQNQDNNHNDAVSTTTTTMKQAEKKQKKKTPLEMISQGTCLPGIPTFVSFAQHRQWMLEHMALAFRVFARKGYCEGMSGHISVRDPENVHTFW